MSVCLSVCLSVPSFFPVTNVAPIGYVSDSAGAELTRPTYKLQPQVRGPTHFVLILSASFSCCFILHVSNSSQLSSFFTCSFCVVLTTVFSARCNVYISRLCYDVSVRLFICLSVTEVHWTDRQTAMIPFLEGRDHCWEEWRDHLVLC